MNRIHYLALSIVILWGIQPVFAQQDESAKATGNVIDLEFASDSEFTKALEASSDIELINKNDVQSFEKKPAPAEKPVFADGASIDAKQETSGSIRDNEYLLESQRLTKLAEEAYNYGDYDASAAFAEEAIRYAELSDEYIARQTGITIGVPLPLADGTFPLPATYTIRAWSVSHDCFWNIAGRPWVYGNPRQWRVLYNANKAKLADPNNPNVIEPGIVLDIPSLKGEVRQGAWDGNKTYKPLQ